MLFSSVRVNPWSERCSRSLSGRSTRIVPLSRCNRIRGLSRCESAPLGPLTVTVLSSAMSISTAAGIGTGRFPILDIAILPRWTPIGAFPLQHLEDGAEDLATDSSPPGLVTGHDPLRGAHHSNPQTAAYSGDVIFPCINAQTRFTDPLDFSYRRLSIGAVPERNDELILRPPLDDAKVGDIALFFEDFRYRHQDLRRRHRCFRLPGHPGIANPGQHVADRIVDTHPSALLVVPFPSNPWSDRILTNSTSSRLAGDRPMPTRGNRSGRARTSACMRGGAHRDDSDLPVEFQTSQVRPPSRSNTS